MEEVTSRADARPVCETNGREAHYNAGRLQITPLLKSGGRRYNANLVWLQRAHRALDEVFAAAHGWKAPLSAGELLKRLFELNQERAGPALQRELGASGSYQVNERKFWGDPCDFHWTNECAKSLTEINDARIPTSGP